MGAFNTWLTGRTTKATPVDADETYLRDSAAAGASKKLTWVNIKATLKAYFDTLYATTAQGALASSATQPGTDAADLGSGAAADNLVLTADGIGGAAWEESPAIDVPPNVKSAPYTLALVDRGRSIDTNSGVTVPPNSTVAFGSGSTITITNTSASAITVTQGAGVTLRQAGATATGNRTLSAYGMATLRKTATDTWFISGAGLT